jgi:polar amino acid transport system substrate-binding protein
MANRYGLSWAVALMIVATTIGAQIGSAPLPVHAAELHEIIERGYLVVAVKDNWRPLGFRDQTGELTGLEIEIARRLAADVLGDPNAVELRPVANADRLSQLLNGEVDLVVAGVTATNGRSRLVSFSTPYYLDGTALITRSPSVQQLSDLSTQTVAVLQGSSAIARVRASLPQVHMWGVESYQEALAALESGDAIAFAGDASVLAGWVQEYPDYRILPTVLSAEALAIAMPRGNQYDPLRRQVNAAIETWYRQGWLAERLDYWGLPQ